MRIYLSHAEMLKDNIWQKGVVLYHEIHGIYIIVEKNEPIDANDVGFVRVLSHEEAERGWHYQVETVECRLYTQDKTIATTSTPCIVRTDEVQMVATVDPHLDRFYLWGPMCIGRRVLDVGCGWGYGTQIMGKYASRIVGIDPDMSEIEYARLHHGGKNIKYVCSRLENFKTAPFDVEVCTEVLEHLGDADVESLLSSMAMRLKPSGFVLITTPCQNTTKRGDNRHHMREYCYVDLIDVLSKHFRPVSAWWYDWPTCTASNRYRSGGRDGKQSMVSQCIFCKAKE